MGTDLNHNYRFDIAYRGTNYKGWQVQPDQPTIQGTIYQVLKGVIETPFIVRGASRTDAGVHALHQVVSLRTSSAWRLESFHSLLNSLLPSDIRVLRVTKQHPKFRPRYGVKDKTYVYVVLNSDVLNPVLDGLVWHVSSRLDLDVIKRGAEIISGVHDFSSFYKPDKDNRRKNPVIPLECNVFHFPPFILFKLRAKYFLRYMVRKIVGTLVYLGARNLFLEDFQFILEAKNPALGKYIAPPSGLYLAKIVYDWEDEEEVTSFLREKVAFAPIREIMEVI